MEINWHRLPLFMDSSARLPQEDEGLWAEEEDGAAEDGDEDDGDDDGG